jgi:hypothetical protein
VGSFFGTASTVNHIQIPAPFVLHHAGCRLCQILQALFLKIFCFPLDSTLMLGLATEFRSKKIPRNRLGTASVISRKKLLISRHSEVYGRGYSEARNGRKWHETANRIDSIISSETCFGMEFRVVVSSTVWFGTEFQVLAYIFTPRNGIQSVCF